jgi:transcriptional regulator with PAS, ATPase and Fis domain
MTHLQPLTDRITKLQQRLNRVEESLAVQRDAKFTFEHLIGASDAMVNVHRLARRAAQTDATVLLLGETGTGKELVAHAIHSASPRFGKPFISLNVAAIPDTLLEAEFFGVEPGAYTGASRQARAGKFQMANKGTLFLDEIGDMPLPLQSKLLRVLQEQEVESLGSNKLVKVDVRIIAATSRDLLAMVQDGSFRSDLYYRLNVLPIKIPPLRDRLNDIELLAQTFIDRIGAIGNELPFTLSAGAIDVLKQYDWPGNVRELENVLRQACLRADAPELTAHDFAEILQLEFLPARPAIPQTNSTLTNRVEQTERDALIDALQRSKGNKAAAARMLGIARPSLYAKMAKYQIGSDEEKK